MRQAAATRKKGPRLVFADGTQSIYLADMSGDGLTDLVRIRNGEVCYWPNLGYGRFGAKVTMDNAPWFDAPDQFDQRRIRLADIDGSGTTDIIYLGRDGVAALLQPVRQRLERAARRCRVSRASTTSRRVHGARSARQRHRLPGLVVAAARRRAPADALRRSDGRAEAAPAGQDGQQPRRRDARPLRAVDQVLPRRTSAAGKPWITRLPFPVHVVERVETYDRISRNRFVTRYAYHHGYFDGVEREFRGFGMVEQWDTEEFAALERERRVPRRRPTSTRPRTCRRCYTKTWFHTGAYLGPRSRLQLLRRVLLDADDRGEYLPRAGTR